MGLRNLIALSWVCRSRWLGCRKGWGCWDSLCRLEVLCKRISIFAKMDRAKVHSQLTSQTTLRFLLPSFRKSSDTNGGILAFRYMQLTNIFAVC